MGGRWPRPAAGWPERSGTATSRGPVGSPRPWSGGIRKDWTGRSCAGRRWSRWPRTPPTRYSLACAALAAWARQPTNHAAHQVQQLAATRERLATALATLPGVRVWPSAANFLLLQVRDGPAVRQGLAARGIAVRPCHSFPGLTANHLRVAVRDPADNQRLLDAFREVLGC